MIFNSLSEAHEKFSKEKFVVTIGNFDGVHRGHKFLVESCSQLARSKNEKLIIITFEPHPIEIFAPEKRNFLIYPFEEKVRKLMNVVVMELLC